MDKQEIIARAWSEAHIENEKCNIHSNSADDALDWLAREYLKTENNNTEALRDHFAGIALGQIIAKSKQLSHNYGGCANILFAECATAYEVADAMIDTRNERMKRRTT